VTPLQHLRARETPDLVGQSDNSPKQALGGELDAYVEDFSTRLSLLHAQIEHERRERELESRVLEESVAILKARLSQVENSLFLRFNRALGIFVKSGSRKLAQVLGHESFDILRRPR